MADRVGGGIIQRVVLELDKRARTKVAEDAKATGKEMGQGIAKGVDESADAIRAKVREALKSGADVALVGGKATAAAAPIVAVNKALTDVTKSAPQAQSVLARLREPLTALAVSASGVPGPLGTLTSMLGSVALGGALTAGIVAGIAAIGFAWDKLTEKTRKAAEESAKAATTLRQYLAAERPQEAIANAIGTRQGDELRLVQEMAQLRTSLGNRRNAQQGAAAMGAGAENARLIREETARLAAAGMELAEVRQQIEAGQRELQRVMDAMRNPTGDADAGIPAGPARAPRPSGARGAAAGPDSYDLREAGRRARSNAYFSDRAMASAAAAGIPLGGAAGAGAAADADSMARMLGIPTPESIASTIAAGLGDVDTQLAQFIANNPFTQMKAALQDGLGNAMADGIGSGFAGLFSGGGIENGFKELTGAMLAGLGNVVYEFGRQTFLASSLMAAAKKALSSLFPEGGMAAGLAMMALGTGLQALGRAASNSFGNMGGGYTGYAGSSTGAAPGIGSTDRREPTTIIYLDAMDARNPVHVEVMGRMMNAAETRGLVKVLPRTGSR